MTGNNASCDPSPFNNVPSQRTATAKLPGGLRGRLADRLRADASGPMRRQHQIGRGGVFERSFQSAVSGVGAPSPDAEAHCSSGTAPRLDDLMINRDLKLDRDSGTRGDNGQNAPDVGRSVLRFDGFVGGRGDRERLLKLAV